MDSPLYQRLLEVNKSVILLNTLQNCPKEEDFDIEALTGTLKLSTNFTDVAQQSKEVFTLVEQVDSCFKIYSYWTFNEFCRYFVLQSKI